MAAQSPPAETIKASPSGTIAPVVEEAAASSHGIPPRVDTHGSKLPATPPEAINVGKSASKARSAIPVAGAGEAAAESAVIRNLERAEQKVAQAARGKSGMIVAGIALASAAAVGLWALLRSKGEAKRNHSDGTERMVPAQSSDVESYGIPPPPSSRSGEKSWVATVTASRKENAKREIG